MTKTHARQPIRVLSVTMMTLALLALLAGCETAQRGPTAARGELAQSAAQHDLDDAVALYDRGEYAAAIKKLNAVADADTTSTALKVTARKYLAFSYCVTKRTTLCRQQFEEILNLEPNFDLEPGEKGHPLWGPVFDRVKKAR